eukprot:gene13025-biopygen94
MRFNTIQNNGCLFGGDTAGLGFNWAIKTTFSGATGGSDCCIMGCATTSGEKVAVVGSNNLSATLWTPLYIQPVNIASSYIVMGGVAKSTALAS